MAELPKLINPRRLADIGSSFSGLTPITHMQRLKDLLFAQESDVNVEIFFGRDEAGLVYVKGNLKGDFILQCQRCLQAFDYKMVRSFSLSPVVSDAQAMALPSQYDPLLMEEESIPLLQVVEDELLLGLPFVPMHDLKDCSVKVTHYSTHETGNEFTKKNPFKVLSGKDSK
jgi:uncharacterized protein